MRIINSMLVFMIFFHVNTIFSGTRVIQNIKVLAPTVREITYKVYNLNDHPAEIKRIEIGTKTVGSSNEDGILKSIGFFQPQFKVPTGWVGLTEQIVEGYYYIVFEVLTTETPGIVAGSSLEFSVITDHFRLFGLQQYNVMYNYIRYSTSKRTEMGKIISHGQEAVYYEPFHFLHTFHNVSNSGKIRFINPSWYGITDMPNSNWLVPIDFDIGVSPTDAENFRTAYIYTIIKSDEYAKFKTPIFDMIKRPPTNTPPTPEQSEFEVSFNLKYTNYWDIDRDGNVSEKESIGWYYGTKLIVNFINSQTNEIPYSFELYSLPESSLDAILYKSVLLRHNNDNLTSVIKEKSSKEWSGVGPFSKWKSVKLKSYSNGKIALFFGEDALMPTWFNFTGSPMNNDFNQLEFVYGPRINETRQIAIDNIMVRKLVNSPVIHKIVSEVGKNTNIVIPNNKFTIFGSDFGTDISNITVRIGNKIVAIQNLTQNSFEFEMPEIFGVFEILVEVNGVESDFPFEIVCPSIVPTIITPLLLN